MHNRRTFTRADTLLGALNPYRTCYDVRHYALSVSIDPTEKRIAGEVVCTFTWLGGAESLQVDLEEALTLQQLWIDEQKVPFRRVKGTRAIWADLRKVASGWAVGSVHRWRAVYAGSPRSALRPPWDGGLVWQQTPLGQPWLAVTCQGLGASIWWPLKDHLSDEPDSVTLTFCVPPPLRVIANGQPAGQTSQKNQTCFTYRVTYPINTYNITFYAAPDYVTVEDTFHSVSGAVIPLRFSVLERNQDKVPYMDTESRKVLRALEHYFGPFPPQRDGFGLVESPYYGMEHQSAIAYGNRFRPEPEWGFDYIILHETGHEWWGNHVTASDNADLWIQEGFCTYSEALYVEYYHGYEAAKRYLLQQRRLIQNRQTIQGPYGVNSDQTYNTDIYYKMAWVLHTLRSRVQNDSLWFAVLRSVQDSFSFRTISGADLIAFLSRQLGEDLGPFFRAYLYYLRPPVVSYKVVAEGGQRYLLARWITQESAFRGPMEFLVGDKPFRVELTQAVQRFPLPVEGAVVPDRTRFYVLTTEEP